MGRTKGRWAEDGTADRLWTNIYKTLSESPDTVCTGCPLSRPLPGRRGLESHLSDLYISSLEHTHSQVHLEHLAQGHFHTKQQNTHSTTRCATQPLASGFLPSQGEDQSLPSILKRDPTSLDTGYPQGLGGKGGEEESWLQLEQGGKKRLAQSGDTPSW